MAFTLSDFVEPEVAPDARSEFTSKMNGMPVGKAMIVSGMSQSNLGSRVTQFKIKNPGKKFTIANLRDGRFQVARVE